MYAELLKWCKAHLKTHRCMFLYLAEEDVKKFFIKLADTFPGSDIFFEAANPLLVQYSKVHNGEVKKMKLRFDWGIYFLKNIQKWDNRIELLGKYYYYNKYRKRWKAWFFLQLSHLTISIMRIAHVRFKKE